MNWFLRINDRKYKVFINAPIIFLLYCFVVESILIIHPLSKALKILTLQSIIWFVLYALAYKSLTQKKHRYLNLQICILYFILAINLFISSIGWLNTLININFPYFIIVLALISSISLIFSVFYFSKMLQRPIKKKKNNFIGKYAFFIGLTATTSYFLIPKEIRRQVVPISSVLACLVLAVFFQHIAIMFVFKDKMVRQYRSKY